MDTSDIHLMYMEIIQTMQVSLIEALKWGNACDGGTEERSVCRVARQPGRTRLPDESQAKSQLSLGHHWLKYRRVPTESQETPCETQRCGVRVPSAKIMTTSDLTSLYIWREG